MKHWVRRALLVGATVGTLALPKVATAGDHRHPFDPDSGEGHGKKWRKAAPEFDPAVGGAMAALLAGGCVMLARRRKQPQ